MKGTTVAQDVEGLLIATGKKGAMRYAKRLALPVACHAYGMTDLENVPDTVVEQVQTVPEKECVIRYAAQLAPVGLADLTAYVRPGAPLALWRLASLALGLGKTLVALHDEDLPQVVLHAGRLARRGHEIVLLPTLPCVLPPLSSLLGSIPLEAIACMAPEVLRTRALTRELLYKGDVFSLGKLILAASQGAGSELDAFALAERQVEGDAVAVPEPADTALAPVLRLAEQMCAYRPEDRPSLSAATPQLAEISLAACPLAVFQSCLATPELVGARDCLLDIETTPGLCGLSQARLHLMFVELALATDPPSFDEAVNRLNLAEADGEDMHDQMWHQLWRGRMYSRYERHDQHISLSASAYEDAVVAARVLDEQEVLREALLGWVNVLAQANDLDAVMEVSALLPSEERPLSTVALRAEGLLQRGEPLDAWHELAAAMPRFAYSQELFDLTHRVGLACDALTLVKWVYRNEGQEGLDTARAVVWFCNGNREQATECLAKACGETQENEGPIDAASLPPQTH